MLKRAPMQALMQAVMQPIWAADDGGAAPPPFPYTITPMTAAGGGWSTASAGTSPSGNPAIKLSETAVTTDWYLYVTTPTPSPAGKTRTWAVEFLLDPSYSHSTAVSVRSEDSGGGAISGYFDISTGAASAGSGTTTRNVIDLGGGWKRLEIVFSGSTQTQPAIEFCTAAVTSHYLGVVGKYYTIGACGYADV